MMYARERIDYDDVRTITVEIDGRVIEVVTKPGVPGWEEVGPAAFLLADAVNALPKARVLVVGSAHGALAAALARRAAVGRVVVLDRDLVALRCVEETLARNGLSNARVVMEHTVIGVEAEPFDVATLEIPNDRKLARRWLAEVFRALKLGGALNVAGANRQGIKSVVKDAGDLFGDAELLRYRQGHRVARAVKRPGERALPEWFREPGIASGTWNEFEVDVRGRRLSLRSLAGVFAHGRLDDGTAFLLGAPGVGLTGRVLDVGCGYGVIGLVAALEGASAVDLVDANLLAVASARENVARHGLANVRVLSGDGVEPVRDERYDVVVTNPPFHVGGETDAAVAHAFIAGSADVLKPGGRFYLVANRPLAYEPMLRARFGQVERVAASNRYVAWMAR